MRRIFQVPNLRGVYAKLDSVVLYGDIHPITLIRLVNRICENWQEATAGRIASTIEYREPNVHVQDMRGISGVVPSWKKCEARRRGAFCIYKPIHSSTSIQSTVPVKIDGRQ